MTSRHGFAVPLQEISANSAYRKDIIDRILGRPGKYSAFFRVYDELFEIGRRASIAEIGVQQDYAPINHAAVLTAAQHLKGDSTLSLERARHVLSGDLGIKSVSQVDSIITLAVQAMLMADINIRTQHTPHYIVGSYYRPEWRHNLSFVQFIDSCFSKISAEQQVQVARILDDKASLSAGNLSSRIDLRFKGTNNIAEHLLLDVENLTLYFFHHAEYIRAHLDSWATIDSARTASLEESLKRGTLCPALLAETLRSTQSILFCYDDRISKKILRTVVDEQKLDPSCMVHEGYRMFDDTDEDLPYTSLDLMASLEAPSTIL
ncbi:hypothetical protein G7054_g1737 [Neopestalotiopsis clavispora]|nr:hypothetical protein G7054_g1737 [Neopestalotiopsis clavispora]